MLRQIKSRPHRARTCALPARFGAADCQGSHAIGPRGATSRVLQLDRRGSSIALETFARCECVHASPLVA
jgi:hypothetical protein